MLAAACMHYVDLIALRCVLLFTKGVVGQRAVFLQTEQMPSELHLLYILLG